MQAVKKNHLTPLFLQTKLSTIIFMQTKSFYFISAVVTFILVALVVFVALKAINKMKKAKAPEPAAGPSSTDALLMEIRDSLKK